MYIHTHTHIYIYIYIYLYVYIHMYIYICMYPHTYVHSLHCGQPRLTAVGFERSLLQRVGEMSFRAASNADS